MSTSTRILLELDPLQYPVNIFREVKLSKIDNFTHVKYTNWIPISMGSPGSHLLIYYQQISSV